MGEGAVNQASRVYTVSKNSVELCEYNCFCTVALFLTVLDDDVRVRWLCSHSADNK